MRALFVGLLLAVSAQAQVVSNLVDPDWQWKMNRSVVDVTLADGRLVVEYCARSQIITTPGIPTAAHRWREIYVARGGRIVLERTIDAKVVPEMQTPERVEWPK